LARVDELEDPIEKAAIAVFRNPGDLLNFAWLNLEDTLHASFDVDGEVYHAIFRPFPKMGPWPWVIGVYVAETDFIGPIRRGERNKMIVAIAISAAITLVAFLMARRLIRPVVALRDEVDRDVLTGVHNRRSLFEIAPRLVQQARRSQSPLSIIIVDIDQFKKINDTHGHTVGDEVLTAVVNRLGSAVEQEDLLTRYAGDEFVLLLPQVGIAVASQVAERLCAAIRSTPIKTTYAEIAVTVSAGVADLGPERDNFEMIFDEADRALRFAKVTGRNRVAVAGQLPASKDTAVAAC
jgi:diguanylate cyclase (GGDEF)-like protein